MSDSVIVMKVKNGYIVRPDLAPRDIQFDNREIFAFETFGTLVTHLEMVFEIEDFFGGDDAKKEMSEVTAE